MNNDEKAEMILATLVKLWCDQNGIVPGEIIISKKEKSA